MGVSRIHVTMATEGDENEDEDKVLGSNTQ